MRTIIYIQQLRGIAILAVLLYHITALTPSIKEKYYFEIGKIGVDVFFIVSGYIMAFILERRISTREFVLRRVFRILPLYYVVLLLASIALFAGTSHGLGGKEIEAVAKSILFIPEYSLANDSKVWPIFIPGWTINYEMWFYLSIALYIFYSKKYGAGEHTGKCVLAIVGVVYTVMNQLVENSAIGSFLSNSVYFAFIVGVYLRRYEVDKSSKRALMFVILYLALLSAVVEGDSARFLVLGLPSALIFIVSQVYKEKHHPILVFIGGISFSLYLTHVFAINLVSLGVRKVGVDFFADEIIIMLAILFSVGVSIVVKNIFEDSTSDYLVRKYLK